VKHQVDIRILLLEDGDDLIRPDGQIVIPPALDRESDFLGKDRQRAYHEHHGQRQNKTSLHNHLLYRIDIDSETRINIGSPSGAVKNSGRQEVSFAFSNESA